MKRTGKPTFFVVAFLILALAFTAFFGISYYYGDNQTIILKGAGDIRWGIDISGGSVYGKPIVASRAGTVITATSHYSYGNYVIISHGDGYSTLYAHCSRLNVSVGQTVSQGQTIAFVGNSGDSTGPHLHFEVRKGSTPVNPLSYVNR